MKVFEYFPAASMRNGFMQAAAAWTDAALVEFGSEGTMHYAQRSIHGDTSNLFTSAMREKDIIFGDTDTLEQAVCEVDKTVNPKFIFVTSSPVSEVIGTDLALVCRMLQPQVKARLCALDAVLTESTALMGREKAFSMAASLIDSIDECKDKSGAVILGLTDADYNGKADLNELRRMMKDYFGIETLNTVDCRYALSDLARAEVIISISPESKALADKAHELWGVPIVSAMPYGLKGTEKFIDDVSSALGTSPSEHWKGERYELRREIMHFKEGLRRDMRRRVYLDVRSDRMEALNNFLSAELGIATLTPKPESHAISTDGAVEPVHGITDDDVIAACGVLIRLHPDNRALCLEEPTAGQKIFGAHIPYMGLRGAMSMMTLFHPLIW